MQNIGLIASSSDCELLLQELATVLQRAGVNIVNPISEWGQINALETYSDFMLSETKASILVLGSEPGAKKADGTYFTDDFFVRCMHKIVAEPGYRLFIWQTPLAAPELIEPEQEDVIEGLRNSIGEGMTFTNVLNPIMLVDDIRSALKETVKTVETDMKLHDILLICNEMDETEVAEIADMLSDVVPAQIMSISQDNDEDQGEASVEKIHKSKLAVVYFKESADWALPFVQQIWKRVGGASSPTPILLVGTDDPNSNAGKKFSAPKVTSIVVNQFMIPLEIKAQFDKIA